MKSAPNLVNCGLLIEITLREEEKTIANVSGELNDPDLIKDNSRDEFAKRLSGLKRRDISWLVIEDAIDKEKKYRVLRLERFSRPL